MTPVRHPRRISAMLACFATVAAAPARIPAGARYVAMGSSYAAGPGIAPSADAPATRCARSANNYAHLLAARLRLRLSDVSCSGATTRHLLGAWESLPAQLDALTADTRLVTITIGGNDVAYIGTLGGASCRMAPMPPAGTPGGSCPAVPVITPENWAALDEALRAMAGEVRRRSPSARLVFVDYLSVLPERGRCAATPLTDDQADASRAVARRLAALTAEVAIATDSEVLQASALSKDHDACSAEPWITGFPRPGETAFVPYHPNARGMAAIADALARRLTGTAHGSGDPRS